MNPAPDAELASVGEFYHNWITNAVTDLVLKRLNQPREAPRYRWDSLLSPKPTRTFAVASQVEQQSRTIQPALPSSQQSINDGDPKAAVVGEPATETQIGAKPTARKQEKTPTSRSKTT